MNAIALHPQLAKDTMLVGRIAGSQLLLMNDARYPWLILVPEHDELRELHELADASYVEVTQGIKQISEKLQALTEAPKMNVAALGNQVPQLHIHIIARRHDDHAWPGPVWGVGEAVPYSEEERRILVATLQEQLLD
ncbi:MAG: HIT domain-containing protein [Pseudomonadales bacterium]|nr:HIT domain-containing protein [Pseudomonadales bacterium]